MAAPPAASTHPWWLAQQPHFLGHSHALLSGLIRQGLFQRTARKPSFNGVGLTTIFRPTSCARNHFEE